MPRRSIRSFLPLFSLFALSLLSCGREITGPEDGVTRPARSRFAYLAVDPQFPSALVQTPGAGNAVPFEKVRIVLRREDGSIALDTLVDFPVGADEVSLTLQVPIPTTAPASGLPLALNLNYINAAGQTVFSGGPINITATPSGNGTGGGNTPTPVSVPISYTGPGSGAVAVRISPKTGLATAGGTVTFSAEALDAAGAVIPNTPVIYSTPDPTRIQILSPTTGQVRFLADRGVGRITASLLTGPSDQAAFDITLPASRIALASGNAQRANVGTALAQPVTVRVSAADDVPVADVPVTFAVVTGGGSVTTATVTTNASGIASTSWRLGSVVGAQSLQATATGLTGSPVIFTATAIGTTPTKLVFSSAAANGTAAQSLPTLTVATQDEAGNLITAFTGDVTVALGANPATATLSGTRTVKAVDGIASFTDLKIDRAGTGFTLIATSGTLTGATSTPFNIVAGSASKLAFTQQPAETTVAGAALAPAIAVRVEDASGNLATAFTGAVSLRLIGGTPNTPITGVTTVNAVAGVATFPGISVSRVGTTYALVAEAAGIGSATSTSFEIRAAAAKTVALTAGGSQTGTPGIALAPITVLVLDQFENPVANAPVTFTVLTGGGTTTPSTTVTTAVASPTAALGTATTLWTLGNTLGTQTLRAALTADPSVNFTVSANAVPGAAARIVISTEPAVSQMAGTSLTPAIVAAVKDAGGFTVTNFTGAVSLAIVGGPSGATITGTSTVNAVAGVATFTNVQLPKAGSGYRLEVASSALAPDTTVAFAVASAAAAALAKATPANDAQSGLVSSVLPLPYRVQVTDAFGNAVSGVTINWSVTSGGGSITPSSATDASGIASATLTLPGAPATVVVNATASGLAGAPVTFTATALSGEATSMIFATAPAAAYTAGVPTGTIVLHAKDAQNNLASGFTGEVSVSIATGPTGATIGGTTAVSAVAGVATFSNLTLTKAGTYTLRFSSGALPPLVSASIAVSAAAPTTLSTVSGNAQSGVVGTLLAEPLTVRVTDAFGNAIAGTNITWSVTTGGGSIPATSVTDAAGEATALWTLGATAGPQSAQASVSGLSGSPQLFTATAQPGAAAGLAFSTAPASSYVAGSTASAIVIQAKDAQGNLAASFTGAVSVAITAGPSGAVIGGPATVNAVGGVATFSGLSFAKAGSYTLSFSSGALPPLASSSFTVTAAAPAVLSTVSGNAQSGLVGAALPAALTVRVTDSFSNAIAGVTVAWSVTVGGGSITTSSVTNAAGEATANWTLGATAGPQSAQASVSGLTGSPQNFSATAQPGAAAGFGFATAPASSYIAGGPAGAIVLQAKDAQGNIAAGFAGAVSVAITSGPSGATIGGTTTVNAIAGVVTFSGLTFTKVGTYTLSFSSGALPPLSSASFTVTAAAPAALSTVGGNAQSGTVGTVLAEPLTVRVTDGFGNAISGVNVAWAVTAGGGSIPANSVTNTSGEATALWTLGATAGAQSAQASVTGLTGSPQTFTATATAGAPTSLVFTTQPPASAVAGAAVGPLVVEVRDALGNRVTSFTGNVTLSMVTTPPGGGLIGGAPTVAAVGGVATFSTGLALNKVGAYSYGAFSGTIASATSSTITITPAAAAAISEVAGGGQTGQVGQALTTPLQVLVTDNYGNPINGHTVNFAVASGGGSLGGTTVTNASGIASAIWTLGGTVGAQSVTATSTGLGGSPVTFTATATAGAATVLSMSTQPSVSQTAGAAAGAIIVAARDAAGNIATSFNGVITMSILTGPSGATILGNAAQNATNGELNYGNIAFNKTGSYVLQFTSPGLTSVNSASFTVSNTAGDTVAVVAGNAQTGAAGQPLGTPLQVRVVDRYGNAVPGHRVTFAVASGGGSVSTAPVTDANGRTSATWTLGTTVGAQSVTATADFFLNGSPITFTATATATTANRLWTGAVSSEWNNAANWSPAIVPAPTDSVLIPAGTTNAAVLPTSSVALRHLRMESGTTLALSNNDLTVAGDVEAATISGTGTVILTSATTGTVRGTIPALRVSSAGSYTVSGTLQIGGKLAITAGSLELGTQTVTLGDDLEVGSLGALRMTGTGSLTVNGDASFGGLNTTGTLTNGLISLKGNFVQSGTEQSFQPSGAHKVRLTGTTPQTISFSAPDTALATTCAASCFATLESTKGVGDGGVIFTSAAKATGTLSIGGDSVSATGRRLIGNAVSLTSTVVRARNVGWGSSISRTGGTFAVDTLTAWGTNVTLPLSENLPTIVTGTANTAARHYSSILVDGAGATLSVTAKDTIFQQLITRNGGRLAMQQATDTLIVMGNATFNGGSTAGLLTAGRLDLHGAFSQGGSSDAFHADPDHSTWLVGAGDQSVRFADPGASHFGDLYLAKSSGDAVLDSDVEVDGELETGVVSGHRLAASVLRTIRSRGADVRDLRFNYVRWELRDGSAVSAIEDVTFQTMPTTATQLDIERSSGAITLNGITFQTVPTTGKYLRVADSNGATDGALAVTAARPSPSNHGGLVDVVAPATLSGWTGILSLVWQGNTNSDWGTASNWSPAFVPGVADSVVIPSGRSNYPTLASNTQIKHLAVGANASLNFANGANLGVLTSMINAPSASIGLGGLINMQGGGPKTVQGAAGTLYINGAVTATGPVMTTGDLRIFANGSLTVNGQTIDVANELFVGFGALLRMTNSADTVLVGTHATWGSDAQNSAGQMTAGFLRIGGNFTTTGGSFSPSGSHRTEFNSSENSQTMAWTSPNGGQFHHLTFRGGGTKTMPSESRVTGDILIASTVTSQITSGGGHVYWSGTNFRDSTSLPNGAWGATATTVTGTPVLFPNRMQSFLKVAGTLQLTDSLRVVGPMDVSGLLDVNGRKLVAEQSFVTWGTGRVTMASTAGTDSLIIKGDALFQGGASTLTKGRTIFGGAFRQCPNAGDCGSTAAFAASGTHLSVFNRGAAGDSVVAFGNPTASFFNDLHLATALTIRLESDVKVAGTLTRSSTLPAAVPVMSDTLILPLMTVSGIEGDITYPINFTSVRLKLTDGTANVRAQKLHFTGFPNNFTGTVFEISRTTPGGVTIEDVIFTNVNLGGGGKYIRNNGNGNANPSGTCRNPLSSGAACP